MRIVRYCILCGEIQERFGYWKAIHRLTHSMKNYVGTFLTIVLLNVAGWATNAVSGSPLLGCRYVLPGYRMD